MGTTILRFPHGRISGYAGTNITPFGVNLLANRRTHYKFTHYLEYFTNFSLIITIFVRNLIICTAMISLNEAVSRILGGGDISIDEALELHASYSTGQLCEAAGLVCDRLHPRRVDTCSIINARSGRCSEDCKWCAQSRHYSTGAPEYEYMPEDEIEARARRFDARGVRRLSLVTGGRRVKSADIDTFCRAYRRLAETTSMSLCASMGLLGREELQALYDAGVRRYHCNLETSSDFFPSLCTTHTHADKLRTIALAREVGMEVCSGGIIGMGETLEQRLRLVREAVDAGAISVPVNILNPIPGTPLASAAPLTDDDLLRTVALMRLVAPRVVLRFAGGRARLDTAVTERMLRSGMNGCMIGDLLTTAGNDVDHDFEMFRRLSLDY